MIGERVKVKVGNDKMGKVINQDKLYLITKEYDNEYGLSDLYVDLFDIEMIERGYERFIVNKHDVEIFERRILK